MLELQSLRVAYENKIIIPGLSVRLRQGEVTALLGLNGAGKSTLLKALVGILPASGSIRVDGQELQSMKPKARASRISYIPQTPDLTFRYQVRHFVEMGATPYANIWGDIRHGACTAEEALAVFGIEHLADCFVDEISGGELRLCYLARCRMQNARWMILDEPTAGLDYKREHEFFQELRNYVSGHQVGVLLSVHNPRMARDYADRILFLDRGEILADVSPKEQDALQESFAEMYGQRILPYI